jgi:hypothetical protein
MSRPSSHSPVIIISILLSTLILSPFASAAQLNLVWDSNTESDLAGYKVYYGMASKAYGSPINVGKVTTYTLTGLPSGQTYFVTVTAYDTSNNESGYSNEVSGTAMTIALKTGWNLISLPNLLGDTLVTDLLSSISGQYERVYTYRGCDTADPWKIYDPTLPPYANDLQYVDNTTGIWIKVKQDTELNISGTFPSTTNIPLCIGQNMISYTGNQAKSIADALSSISGKYGKIYGYQADDTSDPWKIYDPSVPPYVNDLTTIEPGFGYWINVDQNCTLVVNN